MKLPDVKIFQYYAIGCKTYRTEGNFYTMIITQEDGIQGFEKHKK